MTTEPFFLLAIYSCRARFHLSEMLYEWTVGKIKRCKVVIVYGDPDLEEPYRVEQDKYLAVRSGDYYEHLSEKTSALMEAVLDLYPHIRGVLKCDDDMIPSLLHMNQLVDFFIQNPTIHYAGKRLVSHTEHPSKHHVGKTFDRNLDKYEAPLPVCVFAAGPLYYMSRVAMQTFNKTPKTRFIFNEDMMVGFYLNAANIFPVDVLTYIDSYLGVGTMLNYQNANRQTKRVYVEICGDILTYNEQYMRGLEIANLYDRILVVVSEPGMVQNQHLLCITTDPENTKTIYHESEMDEEADVFLRCNRPVLSEKCIEDNSILVNMENTVCIFQHIYNVTDEIVYSCVIPIYNQEKIIVENIKSIIQNTVGPFEIILVLDFCSDNTEEHIMNFLSNYENSVADFIQITVFKNTNKPLFETKCDNIGFKYASGKFCLEIQADMKMTEHGYNLQLTRPFNKFDHVIAVSGRCAHHLFRGDGIGKMGYSIETPISELNVSKDCFYVYETCNRGPLLIDRKKMEELHFLDEDDYFLEDSDHDLMARAYIEKDYICGYVPIDFFAPVAFGSTRTPSNCSINNNEKLRLYEIRKSKKGLEKYRPIWKDRDPVTYTM